MRQGKHEHRNELVFLLDELSRQDGINRDEYTQLNNILAESLESETETESTKDEAESTTMEDDEDEGKLKKLIRSTADYLIQPDKKELIELIKEFRKDVVENDDFLDTLIELKEAHEELLSEEQHLELAKALLNDDLAIKNTKVGQDLNSFPKVKRSGEKFTGFVRRPRFSGTTEERNKVAAVPEELPKRNEISLHRYTTIKGNKYLVNDIE